MTLSDCAGSPKNASDAGKVIPSQVVSRPPRKVVVGVAMDANEEVNVGAVEAQAKALTRRELMKSEGAAAAVAAPFIQTVKAANDQVQYGMMGTGSRGSYLL